MPNTSDQPINYHPDLFTPVVPVPPEQLGHTPNPYPTLGHQQVAELNAKYDKWSTSAAEASLTKNWDMLLRSWYH
jgi:hypothetical protein